MKYINDASREYPNRIDIIEGRGFLNIFPSLSIVPLGVIQAPDTDANVSAIQNRTKSASISETNKMSEKDKPRPSRKPQGRGAGSTLVIFLVLD